MSQERWYVTGILLLMLALCIVVLGLRWHKLSQRVPLYPLRATASAQAQAPFPGSPNATPDESLLRLNVNTASAQELQTLPGIGRVLASRIVEHRQRHGPFRHPSDLLRVEGIGEGKLKAIEDLIDVRPPDSD